MVDLRVRSDQHDSVQVIRLGGIGRPPYQTKPLMTDTGDAPTRRKIGRPRPRWWAGDDKPAGGASELGEVDWMRLGKRAAGGVPEVGGGVND